MSTLEIRDLQVSVKLPEGELKPILPGRPDRAVRRDPRHHGPERLRQVDPGVLDRRPPEVRDHRRPVTLDGEDVLAMTVDERARAGLFLAMQYPVEVPGRRGGQLPADREDRDRRRGAEAAHLGRRAARRHGAARHGPGVRPAQRQRGLLRRREEAARDRAARAAQAEDRDPRRDRLRPRHRRAAGGQRGRQPGPRDRRDRRAADHPLHPDPALHQAGLRARLRRRPDRRGGRPGAGRASSRPRATSATSPAPAGRRPERG